MKHASIRAGSPSLELIARQSVWLILGYFALQLVLRLGLSSNLETDEAQFVGHTAWAMTYHNAHPPLYNWLIAAALSMSGSWPVAVALVKNTLLAGTYLLAYDAGRRVTGRELTGLLAAASLLFLPQIVWKSQITLAHTVFLMFGVMAVLHAVVLVVERGRTLDFLWLGLAATLGAYAKYNFFLALLAVLGAALVVQEIRGRLFTPRLAWAGGLFAVLYGPHVIWVLGHWQDATHRMAKLARENPVFGAIDVPLVGLDGFCALLVAIAAWAGPLILIWLIIWRFSAPTTMPVLPRERDTAPFAKFFGLSTAIGVAAFALIILVGDLHYVHERYLTPLLMPLPFWLVTALPLEERGRAPVHFLRTAGVVVFLMLVAWPLWMLFGREQFAYPYKAFSADIAELAPDLSPYWPTSTSMRPIW